MRSHIEIVMIRAADAHSGDVVNRRGPEKSGWIEVAKVEVLPSGGLVVHDEADSDSFTADGYDIVWLQVLHELKGNSHLAMPD